MFVQADFVLYAQVAIADAEQMEEKMLKEISSRAKDNRLQHMLHHTILT